ncbi:DUF1636 domain-containing protein [Rhizobium sp. BK491]|uniref:DUF1636 family protein n=1 Tax=Rhizobium sp. BK491 TaxID=2587009 RepID=UPI00160B6C70|nr:DUF1636 domain-containing protein [Rhizobium sp. BK491]MBB3571313.1 putative metal-binding protein [Rhizobium sp. BK491]
MHNANERMHRITVCTDCRHFGTPCKPGLRLLSQLQAAIAQAGTALSDDFSVAGSVCMAGCTRPCTVAFQATAKATYLFGDIEGEADIGELVAFARIYRERSDGMTRAAERSKTLAGKTLARIPSAMLSSESCPESLQ